MTWFFILIGALIIAALIQFRTKKVDQKESLPEPTVEEQLPVEAKEEVEPVAEVQEPAVEEPLVLAKPSKKPKKTAARKPKTKE